MCMSLRHTHIHTLSFPLSLYVLMETGLCAAHVVSHDLMANCVLHTMPAAHKDTELFMYQII